MDVNKNIFLCVVLRGYNTFKRNGKVGFAFILSLVAGGIVWHAYQPRFSCSEPSVVRHAIAIKKEQTFFEHTYAVQNRSLQTVTIDSIKASCNCLSVTFDRVIPPRAEGKITAHFAVARNEKGERLADFFVFANKRPEPILHLQMTYSFELGIWAYPKQIDLGRVVSDKPVEFAIHVRQEKDTKRKRSTVQSVEAEGIFFEVLPAQDYASPEAAKSDKAVLLEQKIIGRCANDLKIGYYERVVSIRTDHPEYPLLIVPVRWESVAELNFTPTTLHFGIMDTAAKASRGVTLIAESEPIRVIQAEVSGDVFRLEAQNQIATNRVEFLIGASAGTVPGVYKGQLTVKLSNGKECHAGLLFIRE
jgi:hypothetical protein